MCMGSSTHGGTESDDARCRAKEPQGVQYIELYSAVYYGTVYVGARYGEKKKPDGRVLTDADAGRVLVWAESGASDAAAVQGHKILSTFCCSSAGLFAAAGDGVAETVARRGAMVKGWQRQRQRLVSVTVIGGWSWMVRAGQDWSLLVVTGRHWPGLGRAFLRRSR